MHPLSLQIYSIHIYIYIQTFCQRIVCWVECSRGLIKGHPQIAHFFFARTLLKLLCVGSETQKMMTTLLFGYIESELWHDLLVRGSFFFCCWIIRNYIAPDDVSATAAHIVEIIWQVWYANVWHSFSCGNRP